MLLDTLKKTQITMKRKGFKVGSKRVREWVQNDNKLIPMKGSCCKLNDVERKIIAGCKSDSRWIHLFICLKPNLFMIKNMETIRRCFHC